ncbi:MAG TPA: hypothetical protein VNU48_09425, partial [Burkholderiaceae bacterium]|nr:hypothetical protein [Burkholderiaceae bacterium]
MKPDDVDDRAAGRAPGRSMGHEEAHFVDLAGPLPPGGPADVFVGRGAAMNAPYRPPPALLDARRKG